MCDLSNQNYLDSEKIYANLYNWIVNIVISTSEENTSTSESKIDFSSYSDDIYVHYTITGGEPQGSLNIVVYMIFPDGTRRDMSNVEPHNDGSQYYIKFSWLKYRLLAHDSGVDYENWYGNVTFEFYDDDGNLLASKSVKVSE